MNKVNNLIDETCFIFVLVKLAFNQTLNRDVSHVAEFKYSLFVYSFLLIIFHLHQSRDHLFQISFSLSSSKTDTHSRNDGLANRCYRGEAAKQSLF